MTPRLACCAAAACCDAAVPPPPAFTVGGAAWPGAVGFALVVAGALASGWLVLAELARALGGLTAS
jgi:hypothetical protein